MQMGLRIFILLIYACSAFAQDKGLCLVTRLGKGYPPKAGLIISYKKLLSDTAVRANEDFDIVDENFGKTFPKWVVNTDDDSEIEVVMIDYVFDSIEKV